MKTTHTLEQSLADTFDAIITDSVKRYTHSLIYQGRDWTDLFKVRLAFREFLEMRVDEVDLESGERIAGFYLHEQQAIFGWVRWEKFREGIQRKFWGSIEPNEKGDWKYQVPAGSKRTVWCKLNEKRTMDIDLPQGLG